MSRLLPKWGINPSASLKCTVTHSGKLLSAGLFVRLVPPEPPNLPCGKSSYHEVWCLISSDCWHNRDVQRIKQCLVTSCERALGLKIKQKAVVCVDLGISRKPTDFENFPWEVHHCGSSTNASDMTFPFSFDCIWFGRFNGFPVHQWVKMNVKNKICSQKCKCLLK